MLGVLGRAVARFRRDENGPLPSDPGPAWPESPRLDVDDWRAVFDRVEPETLGVEEELLLVFPETLELAPHNTDLLAELGTDGYFRAELRASQLEIVSPVRRNAAEIAAELTAARRILCGAAAGRYRVVAAGTHPFAEDWGEVSEAERYRLIEDEYTWAAGRSRACGLHVHVAVGGADRSLAVFNALRSYLPEIAALAANSPIFEGRDTGLCSIRPKLLEALPRTGVPPAFRTWDELVAYVDWGRSGGLFPDASFLWWDLRPHPAHGTLELRAADCQTRVEDAAAVAAFVQCLAAELARRDDAGEGREPHPTYRIAENSWRALRYGVGGHLVDLDTGKREPTRTRIARLVDLLEPTARRLRCADELTGVRALIAGNGADRQRYVAGRDGLRSLVRWLADETERL